MQRHTANTIVAFVGGAVAGVGITLGTISTIAILDTPDYTESEIQACQAILDEAYEGPTIQDVEERIAEYRRTGCPER